MMRSMIQTVTDSIISNRRRILFVAFIALVAVVAGPAALPMGIIMIGETKPEDEKGPGDGKQVPPEGGKPGAGDGKPGEGDNRDKNVSALHAKLSERDRQLKDAQAELEKLKGGEGSALAAVVESMRTEVKELTAQLTAVQREKREKALGEKYPDILPELLIDKDDAAIDKIVEAQRARNKQIYGDSRYFSAPAYGTAAEVDAAIEKVQKDPNMSGVQKSVEVMRLTRVKAAIDSK